MSLDSLSVLLISIGALLLGSFIKQHISFFQTFCIPSPVIGGGIVSIIVWIFYMYGFSIEFDNTLQTPLMVMFFTIVGLGGSLRLLKIGGKILIFYLLCCWFVAVFQNLVGVAFMNIFGLNALYGILSGAVALEGGHANAIAFSSMVESLTDLPNAHVLAVAAATFGLISGSLMGGPIAAFLIKRHKLKIESSQIQEVKGDKKINANYHDFIKSLFIVLCIMYIGMYLSSLFTKISGYFLPAYVGSMLLAIVFRNINDSFNLIKINEYCMDIISNLSLGIFLSMAMMTLRIWELSSTALPLLVTLLIQVLLLSLFCIFIVFRICGKNYDSAAMCAGLMGHGLGATPNAVANIQALGDRYGVMSKQAMLIVPLCGSVLIDIVAVPFNTYMINVFV